MCDHVSFFFFFFVIGKLLRPDLASEVPGSGDHQVDPRDRVDVRGLAPTTENGGRPGEDSRLKKKNASVLLGKFELARKW